MPKKTNKIGLTLLIILSIFSILIHFTAMNVFAQRPGDNYMTLIAIVIPGYLLIGIIRLIISLVIRLRNLFMIQEIVFAILIFLTFGISAHKTIMAMGSLVSVILLIISIASIIYYFLQFNNAKKS